MWEQLPRKAQELCPWCWWQNWVKMLNSEHWGLSPELRSLAKCHCPSPSGKSGNGSQHALWVCSAVKHEGQELAFWISQRQCSEISVTVRSGLRMVPKGHQHLTEREEPVSQDFRLQFIQHCCSDAEWGRSDDCGICFSSISFSRRILIGNILSLEIEIWIYSKQKHPLTFK